MKIVIDYQPVSPYTSLTVNGCTHPDMFGELGAVYRYPLQSWLYRRGPWPGLVKVLQDAARGRHMEITFIGRERDYQDFRRAVECMENAACQFEARYEAKAAKALVSDMEKAWLSDYPDQELRAGIEELFLNPSLEEVFSIESVQQYMECEDIIKNRQSVVTLSPDLFWKMKKRLLDLLRENFKRPCESIVLLARTSKEKAVLREEAALVGISVREEAEDGLQDLIEKYSVPETVRMQNAQRAALCAQLEALQERYQSIREANKKMRSQLVKDKNLVGTLGDLNIAYDNNLKEIKWFEAHQYKVAGLVERLRREMSI